MTILTDSLAPGHSGSISESWLARAFDFLVRWTLEALDALGDVAWSEPSTCRADYDEERDEPG